jgi:hypothetical protein
MPRIHPYSDRSTDKSQEKILDPELPLDFPARCTQCHACCDLRGAPRHVNYGKSSEIPTGNEQN